MIITILRRTPRWFPYALSRTEFSIIVFVGSTRITGVINNSCIVALTLFYPERPQAHTPSQSNPRRLVSGSISSICGGISPYGSKLRQLLTNSSSSEDRLRVSSSAASLRFEPLDRSPQPGAERFLNLLLRPGSVQEVEGLSARQ